MMPVPLAQTATTHFPAGRPILPEWTKWAWASAAEQRWWNPYVLDVCRMFETIERESVAHGLRRAAWLQIRHDVLADVATWAAGHGLVVIPKRRISASDNSYSAVEGYQAPNAYRALLVRAEDVAQLPHRLHANDELLGTWLGYPACCRAMFALTWGANQVDSMYDQIANTPGEHPADGPVEANMFWRWIGPRWVQHLPCSMTCEATVEIGRQFRTLAKTLGFQEEAAVLDEILNWPLRWSAVHGIAETVGPCLRVSTRTDWSPELRTARRSGVYHKPESHLWLDNGFVDGAFMYAFHQRVMKPVIAHAPHGARLLDLGCGNGLLLRRIKTQRPDVRIAGIDCNGDAIRRAQACLVGDWQHGSLHELTWTDRGDIVLLALVRLAELDAQYPAVMDAVRAALRQAKQVFVYTYADDIAAGFPMVPTAARYGLPAPAVIVDGSDVQVGLITAQDWL